MLKITVFSFLICISCVIPAWTDVPVDTGNSSAIILTFTDTYPYEIERVSLMKSGEIYPDGQSHQMQNAKYHHQSTELVWNPCNNKSCSVVSLPSSGGKTGRDQLILEVTLVHPGVQADSCYGDTTCERLKGKTRTISGMLKGFFKTGNVYEVSVSSLKPGIGESFTVNEVQR